MLGSLSLIVVVIVNRITDWRWVDAPAAQPLDF